MITTTITLAYLDAFEYVFDNTRDDALLDLCRLHAAVGAHRVGLAGALQVWTR